MFTAYKLKNGTLVEVSQDEALAALGVTAEEVEMILNQQLEELLEEPYMTYEKFLEEPVADYYASLLALMPQEYAWFVTDLEKALIKHPDLWEYFLDAVEVGEELLGDLANLVSDQRMKMYLASYVAYKESSF